MTPTFDQPGLKAMYELQLSLGVVTKQVAILTKALEKFDQVVTFTKKGEVIINGEKQRDA